MNVQRAAEISCQSLRYFIGNPTGGIPTNWIPGRRKSSAGMLHEHGIYPLVVHSAYLISLAAKKKSFIITAPAAVRELWRSAPAPGFSLCGFYTWAAMESRGYREGMELFISTLDAWRCPTGLSVWSFSWKKYWPRGTSLGGTFILCRQYSLQRPWGAMLPFGCMPGIPPMPGL